ncbi:hypothetical protein H2200_006341 [Cladophialophora chaetospira]|uniref:Uncharacterized protein n=1 Tax=Cladophialophora chaetospira TaxID=386627 RepID=A0AA38XAZ7_9EURO|nr:hypothetical protein H2200_006341 [Cladophialophora chaetospira]
MTDTVTFASYGTFLPSVDSTSFGEATPTTTTDADSRTSSSSTATLTASASDVSPTSVATSTDFTAAHPYPTKSVSYAQVLGNGVSAQVAQIPWNTFANSNFDALCPSHDCIKDCQNYTRLFEEVPYFLNNSFQTYGKSIDGKPPDTTLFGVCSNLANINTGISEALTSQSIESYFPLQRQQEVDQVSSSIASCLASTCDFSREPQNCVAACNMPLLYSNGSTTNLTAVTACLSMICGNTCGLPYANQDVMGVGVLVSYVIQAVLIIACAIALIATALYYTFRSREKDLSLSENSQRGLEGFLAAQCYFTIALEIAAICSSPSDIDPLNGYALLSVAITGFLCPAFTLMLLHSRGCRTKYGAGLTLVSYILATFVFWTLYANLSRHLGSTTGSDEALRELYKIPTCGGSSAIALCPQSIGNDPLDYLAGFYNQGSIPNLRTMPLLWGWTTLILILLASNQARYLFGPQNSPGQTRLQSTWALVVRILAHPIALLVACTLFGLSLGYQAEMLRKYSGSDVIDWDGWSFGQVVAVVVFAQPVADYLHLLLRDHLEQRKASKRQVDPQTKGSYVAVSQAATPNVRPSSGLSTPSMQKHHTHSPSNSSLYAPRAVSPQSPLVSSRTY